MNPYLPQQFTIAQIKDLSVDTKLFTLKPGLKFNPGQFVMAGILGIGEAPISIISAPAKNNLELAIRSVGKITQKLYHSKVGDLMSIRGPYGNGFPVDRFRGKNILIMSGGCGLAGLRSMIYYFKENSQKFANLQIFYGARDEKNILFKDEIKLWRKFAEVLVTVEKPNKSYRGNSGLITSLISSTTIDSTNCTALLCGPPIMYKFVSEKLMGLGFEKKDVFISLERNMRCGVGVCQHCTCGEKYVCKDGPVFNLDEIEKMGDF